MIMANRKTFTTKFRSLVMTCSIPVAWDQKHPVLSPALCRKHKTKTRAATFPLRQASHRPQCPTVIYQHHLRYFQRPQCPWHKLPLKPPDSFQHPFHPLPQHPWWQRFKTHIWHLSIFPHRPHYPRPRHKFPITYLLFLRLLPPPFQPQFPNPS